MAKAKPKKSSKIAKNAVRKKSSAKKRAAKKAPKKVSVKKPAAKKPAAKKLARKSATKSKSTKAAPRKSASPPKPARNAPRPKLLSGENPQIAKGEGESPVQAYIDAIPGWKRDAARQLDALISQTIPHAQKAVKWNSPFYGIAGQGWFASFHCFTKYIKVMFFDGASLSPLPPVNSKDQKARYVHINEGEQIDEAQFADWIRQAAGLPGWGSV